MHTILVSTKQLHLTAFNLTLVAGELMIQLSEPEMIDYELTNIMQTNTRRSRKSYEFCHPGILGGSHLRDFFRIA